MKVFKFGGASVKDAGGIRNLGKIVKGETDNLVIVVSAFGKTTNALEKVLKSWLEDNNSYKLLLDEIYFYHRSVIESLFDDKSRVLTALDSSFNKLRDRLESEKNRQYDYVYDQVVSYGEIWSTTIVAAYLERIVAGVKWIDIRNNIITDSRYRDANVLWDKSSERITFSFDFEENRYFVTQGFIGGTESGDSTTLGREGSDFTAAVLGNILNAESVTVWKDVPGIMNADPVWLSDALKLDEISYREAVELTFSGAKVIHPKTIKPLHNKQIPMYVKSFVNPSGAGTIIKSDAVIKEVLPVYIKKEDQILISILPRDFSFVMGENLSHIFNLFMSHGIRVNLVEASAVSLDVCVDDEKAKVETLISDMKAEFAVVYNENVELLTIRHHNPDAVKRITEGREILIEQRTRSTVRFVVRK